MDKLTIVGSGFPGTNKTWRFLQKCFTDPLIALARVSGNKTILEGVVVAPNGLSVSAGFICVDGEILVFKEGAASDTITIIENTENVSYNTDANNDQQLDSLAAYVTRYATTGTGGTVVFPFDELVRLKTIKELSSNPVFTQELLTKLNGIAEGAEVNVQADWSVVNPQSDAFIKGKPNVIIFMRRGTALVGDIVDAKVVTVNFPDIGTSNYKLSGALKSRDSDTSYGSAGVTWCTANHTSTGFTLILRETSGHVSNVELNYELLPL